MKVALEREANLAGISVSELIRRKLGDDESYIPEADLIDVMPQIKSTIIYLRSLLGDLSSTTEHDVAKMVSNSNWTDPLWRRVKLQPPSLYGYPYSTASAASDQEHAIKALWGKWRDSVKSNLEALERCHNMLELVEDLARQNQVTVDKLKKYLGRSSQSAT